MHFENCKCLILGTLNRILHKVQPLCRKINQMAVKCIIIKQLPSPGSGMSATPTYLDKLKIAIIFVYHFSQKWRSVRNASDGLSNR